MSITLQDLLKLPSLNAASVVAGQTGIHAIVSSISVLEYAQPSHLQDELFHNNDFQGGELVISAFVSIKDDVDAQCACIKRLHEAGEIGLILYYVGIFLPTVDEITRFALQDEIKRIHAETKITILFVTHDIREALTLGSKVLVMDQGKLQQYDTPEEVKKNPGSAFVAKLLQHLS